MVRGAGLPAVFSPDASEIAYADEARIGGMRTGRLRVTAARPEGQALTVVTEPGNGIIPYRWMRTGGDLLYWLDEDFSGSARADGLELFRVPADGPRNDLCGSRQSG
jgi:hypothetical protein